MTRPSSLSVYFLFLALQDYNPPVHYTCSSSSRKRARGAQRPPLLFLDQTGAQTAEKIFFWDRVPLLSQGLNDCAPPPLSEGLDPPLH